MILALAMGCGTAPDDGLLDSDDLLDSSAIVPMEVGQSISGSIASLGLSGSPTPSRAEVLAATVIVKFDVPANTRVAAVMRGHTADFDGYLALVDPVSKERLVASDFQVAIPGYDFDGVEPPELGDALADYFTRENRSKDAMITILASNKDRTFYLEGRGGEKRTHAGNYTIDLVSLPSSDPVLSSPEGAVYFHDGFGRLIVDPALEQLLEDMLEDNRRLNAAIEAELIVDTPSGLLEVNEDYSLEDAREFLGDPEMKTLLADNQLEDRIEGPNERRGQLFDWFVTKDHDRDAVGRALATLWAQLAPIP